MECYLEEVCRSLKFQAACKSVLNDIVPSMIGRNSPPPPIPYQNSVVAYCNTCIRETATEGCRYRNAISAIMRPACSMQLWPTKATLQRITAPSLFNILTVNSTKTDCILHIFSVLFIIEVFLFVLVKKMRGNVVLRLKFQTFLYYLFLV